MIAPTGVKSAVPSAEHRARSGGVYVEPPREPAAGVVKSLRPEPGAHRHDPVAGFPGATASVPDSDVCRAGGRQAVQLQKTHRVDLRDAVTVIPASDTILESTLKALWRCRGMARRPRHLATGQRVLADLQSP